MRAEEAAEYLQLGRATILYYIKRRVLIGKQNKARGPVFILTASIRKALERSSVS